MDPFPERGIVRSTTLVDDVGAGFVDQRVHEGGELFHRSHIYRELLDGPVCVVGVLFGQHLCSLTDCAWYIVHGHLLL